MNWQEMSELNGISLTDSYILGWESREREVTFEMDYVLCPEHPNYATPDPSDWACFRPGVLRFIGVTSVIGLPRMEEVRHSTDASGERDYGEIESLKRAGRTYTVGLEFGSVVVEADSVAVSVMEHNNSLQARRP